MFSICKVPKKIFLIKEKNLIFFKKILSYPRKIIFCNFVAVVTPINNYHPVISTEAKRNGEILSFQMHCIKKDFSTSSK